MGDIKHEFRRNNLWEISSIILEGINWEIIKHGFRGYDLWDISSIALGDIICETFQARF